MTPEVERKSAYRSRKRAAVNEVIVLFVFSWILLLIAKLFRSGIQGISGLTGYLSFIFGAVVTATEIFTFAYILSRFFKQYKIGCAFLIIILFAYVVWMGTG